ncbi:MAG: polyprenyl diphosphate synthase [Oscillospiraceae bacterium]|nr:polyprenyl diphosphate synthase [Oscillospiraceae bacterium]
MSTLEHIGIIMDGNRRWASANGLPSFQGHDRGADVFADTCDWCGNAGVGYLTVYAFSTENWKRSQIEVLHIFGLLERFFKEKIERCLENGIKLRVIGERSRYDAKTLSIIEDAEARTKDCGDLYVQIALSYGGRDEIIRAVKKLASDLMTGSLTPDGISEEVLSSYLDTRGIPDVDLVIRTGGAGNRRLSNFLPWQTVYSELYFSELLWPEFSKEEFNKALDYYYSVKRNLGE